jgi:hypothetical protein
MSRQFFRRKHGIFCPPQPPVAFDAPCECRDYHGKGRLTEKNDAALPPTDPNAIQAVTPSDIFSWQGPTELLTRSSARIAAEQKWYAVIGRVVELRAEADGDLHIALQDATGNKPGLACNSLMNELHQCLVFERFCKEAESSRIECGLAH